jgi:hypothetical protein
VIAGTHGVPILVGAFTHRSRPAELFRRRKRLNRTVAGNRPRGSSAMLPLAAAADAIGRPQSDVPVCNLPALKATLDTDALVLG